MRDDVTITIHQPPKCGFHATAIDADGRCAVARGTFGEGYPTEALARAAVRRRIRAMQRADHRIKAVRIAHAHMVRRDR